MLFDVPKTNVQKKSNEYTKAYNMVYSYTNNKKLQDKLLEYVQFRVDDCKSKGFRFYSSSIKSFLDTINEKMPNSTDDEIWEAINLTLSYSAFKLLVPYKNKNDFDVKRDIEKISEFSDYDKYDHTKSERSF